MMLRHYNIKDVSNIKQSPIRRIRKLEAREIRQTLKEDKELCLNKSDLTKWIIAGNDGNEVMNPKIISDCCITIN